MQWGIKDWLNRNRRKGIHLLQRLVQEGSIRGNESSAQAIIIEKCRELGLCVDIWEIGEQQLINHPKFCSDRKDFTGNPNVIGVLKGSGGGRSLILNGHIDVVPEGDRDDWKHDPFSGHIENGKLYGRGSTDMKGGSVALLLAIEAIINLGIQLKGDVIFQSVIEEESGGAGTLAAVLRGYKADGAIIPEPTNMKLFPKQQGSMWFRITVKGRSAHGGTRYEGVSAIEKMVHVIQQLQKLEKRRNEKISDPLYQHIPIPIPINIGKIHSGDWPSSVPDIAVIEGRMGVAPHEKMEEAEQELEAALAEVARKDDWLSENPPKIEWFGGRWLPGNLEENHSLMETISEAFERVTTTKPIIEASPWGTDGGILSVVGNTPVVVFGPGVTAAAHDANEYITIDEMFEAAEIIALSIISWCGVNEEIK
ncbi:peptidase [Bacillus sp. DTU_2020_1000418_1_SI_GHA_SEK_038]|uniref:peptidase n=1 Tax=Bacillus sp. DTU_2020_1000418_1_SI_GHA_SEK_038 TaxID=3077585 RepID=UPI0028E96E57|nr:peptidase [Bacillus sp. DTU_2020_1000418_1_SI_GHA_SEK_038]WNS73894.1 peptidase [Bacillus sp. DTU_2020_1000418_1_SI_GHA_SEK_038]